MTKCLPVETALVKSMRDNHHIEQFTEHTQQFGLKERKEKRKKDNSLRIGPNAVK